MDYFYQLGHQVEVIRNDVPPTKIDWSIYQAVVLAPGPETPQKAGYLMEYLPYALQKPTLGVCLGHQAINLYFGGTLRKGARPMHGKVSEVNHQNDQIFGGVKECFKVVRYHSLVVDQLAPGLINLAQSTDGELMAAKHQTLPIYGLQFHPESILTDFGLKILDNWLKISKLSV